MAAKPKPRRAPQGRGPRADAARGRRATARAPAPPAAPRAGYSTRSRVEKLGVKPDMRVALIGVEDPSIRGELAAVPARVSEGPPRGDAGMVLLRVDGRAELARLAALRARIAPAGCVWVLWPKGQAHIKEDMVRAAALAHGLVDVKVMAFSETLSGLKLVIPVAQR